MTDTTDKTPKRSLSFTQKAVGRFCDFEANTMTGNFLADVSQKPVWNRLNTKQPFVNVHRIREMVDQAMATRTGPV